MDLRSAHYTNNTLIFLQQQSFIPSFIPKDANPPCVALPWPVEDFWLTLKKAFYNGRWEVTSILALKGRIKKAQQIPILMIFFNRVKVHLAVCA